MKSSVLENCGRTVSYQNVGDIVHRVAAKQGIEKDRLHLWAEGDIGHNTF